MNQLKKKLVLGKPREGVTAGKHWNKSLKTNGRDFPGGAVVKNPPANAGDMGLSPGPGRPPLAAEQLSPCTTTTEPTCQNY